jgi:predicted permease
MSSVPCGKSDFGSAIGLAIPPTSTYTAAIGRSARLQLPSTSAVDVGGDMTWLRGLLRRNRHERELARELQFHLERRVDDLIAAGRTRDEAMREARLELGGAEQIREQARDGRSGASLDQLAYDARDAWRALTRTPGITVTAVILIAIVIGGNTTIFSMVHGILTKPAPGITTDRLVTLGSIIEGRLFGPEESYPNYLDYVAQAKTVQALAAYQFARFTVSTQDASYAAFGTLITANYFDTLGLHLARGRTFTREESQRDASGLVAVVSHRFWQNQLQGDDNIIGRVVIVNGHAATIVGVAPPRFNGVHLVESSDVWLPLASYARLHGTETSLNDRKDIRCVIFGQLAPDASLTQARSEFALLSKRLESAYPTANRNKQTTVFPYSMLGTGSMAYQTAPMVLLIMGIVTALTVMIVCANVANLMLARAVMRQRELAVRQSLGASRARIVRTLLAEGLIVSFFAWIAACFAAWFVARTLVTMLPATGQGIIPAPDFSPDWKVVAYAMGLALLATIAFTVAPAVRAYRQAVLPWLKAGEQGIVQSRSKLSSGLVVLQLAFAVLLLTSAGLAYRSQMVIDGRDLGYESDRLLILTVSTTARATNPATNMALLDALRARLRTVPGVTSVAATNNLPQFARRDPVRRVGSEQPVLSDGTVVGPDYLRTLGIAPIAGREFIEQDGARANQVVLINQNLAEALWPGRSPLGETMVIGANGKRAEVVGVVPNALFTGIRTDPRPNMYLLSQHQQPPGPGHAHLFIRYAGTIDTMAPAIARALHDWDAQVPIVYVRSMDTQLASITWPTRMVSTLLMLFAIGSLLIAAIGQYAVMAFNMRRRVRDFGVRIALGASARQVLNGVLAEGAWLTAVGLAIGLVLSFATSAAFRSLLIGVTPADAPTYVGVFTLLAITSLLACYLPARRASRINPVDALRQE